jgi:hypothetical protein
MHGFSFDQPLMKQLLSKTYTKQQYLALIQNPVPPPIVLFGHPGLEFITKKSLLAANILGSAHVGVADASLLAICRIFKMLHTGVDHLANV